MSPENDATTLQRTRDVISDVHQPSPDLCPGDVKKKFLPKIFLSYASEDGWWIEWFTKEKWFGQQIGNIEIVDYSAGDNLDFGLLGKWVDERIHEATVVIAFVSEYYRKKKWTEVEWNKTLTEVQRGRLIFVPIMMDAEAKAWWQDLREREGLHALPDDYMYSDFTVRGKRVKIAQDDAVQEKIASLAQAIKAILFTPPRTTFSAPPPLAPSAPELVVLGHPANRLADDVAVRAGELAQAAREEGLSVREWKDGWRTNCVARGEPNQCPAASAVFVQPLAPGEAAEQVAEVGTTAKRLRAVGVPDPPVVLWLPKGQADPVFEEAAAASMGALPTVSALRIEPALRTDPPRDLALWLRALLRGIPLHDNPVVQIESVGCAEGQPDTESALLSDELSQTFGNIVNGVVETESSSPWLFWDRQFDAQIKALPGSRAIVAVHDLDIPPSTNDVASRKLIELKFQRMQEAVQQTASAGKLKFFWAALLCRNAKALPFVRYPGGRFKDWRLLGFERSGDGPAGAKPRPEPASLGAFRAQLASWVSS